MNASFSKHNLLYVCLIKLVECLEESLAVLKVGDHTMLVITWQVAFKTGVVHLISTWSAHAHYKSWFNLLQKIIKAPWNFKLEILKVSTAVRHDGGANKMLQVFAFDHIGYLHRDKHTLVLSNCK